MSDGRIKAKHGTSKDDFTGSKVLPGFQIKYIYFIDKSYKEKLTVPILPFSKIQEMGAGMYKGIKRGLIEEQQIPSVDDGASPIPMLQLKAG